MSGRGSSRQERYSRGDGRAGGSTAWGGVGVCQRPLLQREETGPGPEPEEGQGLQSGPRDPHPLAGESSPPCTSRPGSLPSRVEAERPRQRLAPSLGSGASLARLPSLPVSLGSGSESVFDRLGRPGLRLSLSPACLPWGTQRGAWTHPSLRGSLSGCGDNCANRHTIRQHADVCGTRPGLWRAGPFQQGPQSSRLAQLGWEAEAFAVILI